MTKKQGKGADRDENGQEFWLSPKNIFNKIIEENIPNLKEITIKVEEAYRILNRLEKRVPIYIYIPPSPINIVHGWPHDAEELGNRLVAGYKQPR